MAYTVFRSDLMSGTDVAADLVSVKYCTVSGSTYTPAEIENGSVVKLDKLDASEREVWLGSTPAAGTALSDIVVVDAPEVFYDERKKNLDEWINEAGVPIRGYRLRSGNIFSITADGFDASSTTAAKAVDGIVELTAGTKLKAVTSATANSTVVGKIIAVETAGRYTYYVIKVA